MSAALILVGWILDPSVTGFHRTRLLQRKFAERFTSPDSRADVNYKAFLAAIDMAVSGPQQVRRTSKAFGSVRRLHAA